MKKTILFLLFSILTTIATAQEKLKLSLEEAIATALENNFGQQILEISSKSSAEDVAQAKRNILPDLNASVSQGISNENNSGSYGVNASATLWKGGQGMNAIRRSQLVMNQADTKIAQSQNELTISVIRAFLSVVMNQDLMNYQQAVVDISEQQMKQGEIKYRSGQILESDYLLLKSQYASDNYTMINSRINRDNALLELKTLLSLKTSTEIDIINPTDFSPEALGTPTLQELIDQTLAWLPDIKIASQNIDLAQFDTKIAKGGLAPTLAIGGSVSTGYSSLSTANWGNQFTNNHNEQLSLSLSIPLWNKGAARSNIRQSNYRLEQAQLEAKQTELSVRSNLEKEYLNVVSLREKYFASEISSNAYRETFKVFSTQYDAGAITTTELLQQQNNFLTAQNTYIQSKYNYLLNRKVLDVYMGSEIVF